MKRLEDARAQVMSAIEPMATEKVSTWDSAGRILASDIHASESVPSFANSAMDGFAVRTLDVAQSGAVLDVIGDLPAGVAPTVALGPGQAVKIMTGAPIPEGADAVVRVEDTTVSDGKVTVNRGVPRGTSIRPAGGDLMSGQLVFNRGERLTPMHIGVLATLGVSEVEAFRRPRVAFMSTGDELAPLDGGPLDPGMIRDSNRPMVGALLTEAGVEPVDIGIIGDDEATMRDALSKAARSDAIVTTGGVSMGDYDVTKLVLSGNAGVEFWKIAVQPAKPFAFGHVEGTVFFGLPGNPVSAMVSFEQLVRPALLAMQGARLTLRPRIWAVAGEAFDTDPEKAVFLRVSVVGDDGGLPVVVGSGGQASNVLSAAALADALAVIPVGTGLLSKGNQVSIELLHSHASREYTRGD